MFFPITVIDPLRDKQESDDSVGPALGSRLERPLLSAPAQDIAQGDGFAAFESGYRLVNLLTARG